MKCSTLVAMGCLVASPSASAALLHHYPFNRDVSDFAGKSNGVLSNGAVVADGVLVLDGVNDFVQFAEKIVPTTGTYSVAMLFRATAVQPKYVELISQGFSTGPGFYLGHTPAGIVRVTDAWIPQNVAFPQDGSWHHIAMTVGGGSTRLYIDGTARALFCSEISTTRLGTNTRLGRQFDNPGTEWFAGQIDEVRIYDETLSESQVEALAGSLFCTEDLTGDGAVNAGDLGVLLGSWGACDDACDLCAGDFNQDGVVDASDLALLLGAWGPCS